MNLKIYNCVGYHATDHEGCESILESQTFILSRDEEEWLGLLDAIFKRKKCWI